MIRRFFVYDDTRKHSATVDLSLAWVDNLPQTHQRVFHSIVDDSVANGALTIHFYINACTPQRIALPLLSKAYKKVNAQYQIAHLGPELRARWDDLIQNGKSMSKDEFQQRLIEIIEAARITDMEVERRSWSIESSRGLRGKQRKFKRLSREAYVWLKEEWSLIKEDPETRNSELYRRYEERRERLNWPSYGTNDLVRIACSKSYQTAIRRRKH